MQRETGKVWVPPSFLHLATSTRFRLQSLLSAPSISARNVSDGSKSSPGARARGPSLQHQMEKQRRKKGNSFDNKHKLERGRGGKKAREREREKRGRGERENDKVGKTAEKRLRDVRSSRGLSFDRLAGGCSIKHRAPMSFYYVFRGIWGGGRLRDFLI